MANRDKEWAELHEKACKAGHEAAEACTPVPMAVTDGKQTWVIPGGVCGFAWVKMAGNLSFARWLKKNERTYKGYPTGLQWFAPLNTQSMTIKEAFCRAYAAVLQAAGVKAYAGSRLD